MNGIATKGGSWSIVYNLVNEFIANRNAEMIKWNLLHRIFSAHYATWSSAADVAIRKMFSYKIRKIHRQGIGFSQNSQVRVQTIVGSSFPLEGIATYHSYRCRTGLCFTATIGWVCWCSRKDVFWHSPWPRHWALAALKCACARLKVNKTCDESGLAAAPRQHVPDEFLVELLRFYVFFSDPFFFVFWWWIIASSLDAWPAKSVCKLLTAGQGFRILQPTRPSIQAMGQHPAWLSTMQAYNEE